MMSRAGARQKKGLLFDKHERTHFDHDRIWDDEAAEIAHPNALAAIAGSKAGHLLLVPMVKGANVALPIASCSQ